LTFDMDREDSKLEVGRRGNNALTLNVLSTFGPQLDKVQIYFDLGLMSMMNLDSDSDSNEEDEENDLPEEHDGAQPGKGQQKPILRPSTSASIKPYTAYIWRTIFGKKTTGAKELDVKFGEWERKGGFIEEEQRKRSFWKVRPGLRDDGADVEEEGCVITCVTGYGTFGGT